MCLIIVKPYNRTIDKEILKKAQEQNSDGFGLYAYDPFTNKNFVYRTNRIAKFQSIVNQYNNEHYFTVIHYRLTSAGNNAKKNVHPFIVKEGWYMFHNGTFEFTEYNDFLSDTNIIARKMSRLTNFSENLEAICQLMSQLTDSRLVFVKNDQYHITNEDMGTWENGIWFSQNRPLKRIPIFVYGTLKKGGGNNSFLNNAVFLGKANTTKKYCIRENGLPKLTKESEYNIKGELYLVDDTDFERVDQLEGHPDFYTREKIHVTCKGFKFKPWAYFLDEHQGDKISEYKVPIEYTSYSPYTSYSNYSNNILDDVWDDVWYEDNDPYESQALFEIKDFNTMIDEWEHIFEEPFPIEHAQRVFTSLQLIGDIEWKWETSSKMNRQAILDEL